MLLYRYYEKDTARLNLALEHSRVDHRCEAISNCPYKGEILQKKTFSNVNQVDEEYYPPSCPKFSSLDSRVDSFEDWPLQTPTPEDLASAGFFYTGSEDLVRCYWCGKELSQWWPKDKPISQHKILLKGCPFLREIVENYSFSELSTDSTYQNEEKKNFMNDKDQVAPKFSSLNSRLESFKDWPLQTPTPEDLASAGFFYTGWEDWVRCYWCGLTVLTWVSENKPVEVHQYFRPNCPSLSQIAENYVDSSNPLTEDKEGQTDDRQNLH